MSGLIAFHELVAVKSWTNSSTRGASIKVLLPSRDSLAAFEKITRRAGKRAGQRYKAVWQDADASFSVPMDLWFAGANWAHQDGATAKFTVSEEELVQFQSGDLVMANDDDQPIFYWLTLVQVDDDEKPVDQKKAEVMDTLKGGPKSKRVALLTQQGDFQEYVYFRMQQPAGPSPMLDADQWVKATCGVASKREFDHNDSAWDLFQTRVMSPFIRWGESVRGRGEQEDRQRA